MAGRRAEEQYCRVAGDAGLCTVIVVLFLKIDRKLDDSAMYRAKMPHTHIKVRNGERL